MIKLKEYIGEIYKLCIESKPYDALKCRWQYWKDKYCIPRSYLDAYRIRGGKEDGKKKYYVFRCSLPDYALFSVGIKMLMVYEWAERNHLIPIVDIEYEQVYVNEELGYDNMWEYSFLQTCLVRDIYKKRNVTVGRVYKGEQDLRYIKETRKKINGSIEDVNIHLKNEYLSNRDYYKYLQGLSTKVWIFQPSIIDAVNHECKEKFSGKRILGLSLRENFNFGKNNKASLSWKIYSKHPSSLGIEQICNLIREYMQKWNFTHIFVATAYEDSIEKMQREFGNKVIYTDRIRNRISEVEQSLEDSWKQAYEQKTEQIFQGKKNSICNESRKEATISYTKEVLLLSKCNYFIGAKCSGTIAACAMNGGQFEDMYIIPDSRNSKKY